MTVNIKVSIGAKAANGIVERQGVCEVGHLDVDNVWQQETMGRQLLPLGNVLGTINHAGLMTKHLCEYGIARYLGLLYPTREHGRSAAAAKLHHLGTGRYMRTVGDSWDDCGTRIPTQMSCNLAARTLYTHERQMWTEDRHGALPTQTY